MSFAASVVRKHTAVVPSSETVLMLACSRLEMRAEDWIHAESALQRGVNWDVLLSSARFHGVIGFLHKHLSVEFSKRIPVGTMATLTAAAAATARRNLRLSAELIALLRLFADHRIPVLPLKGPVLAEFIYGSVGLRRMNDLDFLFKEANVSRVIALLQTRGYEDEFPLPPALEDLDRRHNHHLGLVSRQRGYLVELHYCLVGQRSTRYGLDTILPRTQPACFMGTPIVTMSPEDLLVYMCEHGSNHVWYRIEWLCGIAELLRSGRIQNWDRVIGFANEFKGQRRLRASLRIARDLLDAPVPEEMLVVDPKSERPAHSVIVRLLRNPGSRATPMERFLYLLATDGGDLRTVLQRCWIGIITPRASDIQWLPLPRRLWLAYYCVRPLRLLIRACRRGLNEPRDSHVNGCI